MQQPVVLERGPVRLDVKTDPLRLELRRDGRRLIGGLRLWVAHADVRDRFIHFTEGVVPKERHGPREYVVCITSAEAADHALKLDLELDSGRAARVTIGLTKRGTVNLRFATRSDSLRLCAEWDRRD